MTNRQPIARVTARLRAGEISSVELVQEALARAADSAGEGSRVFTRVYADAVDQAAEQDRRRARGEVASPLAGIPLSIKDLFDVAGETTLAGSKSFASARVSSATFSASGSRSSSTKTRRSSATPLSRW